MLKTRCHRCHGGKDQKTPGLDVLRRETLVLKRGEGDGAYAFVVPGQPDASVLWQHVESDYMPQSGSQEAKEMTAAERETLKQWIAAQAPFPKRREVVFRTEADSLKAIRDFVLKNRADDRPYLRFFSLAHLANNEDLLEEDLRLHRAALSKLINSVSLESKLVLPQPVPETNETIYCVDLRKLGWDKRDLWKEILKQYPYGLKFDSVRDEDIREIAKDLIQFSGSDLPYVRAHWFIVAAAQPPLYHTLLDLPRHLHELEHRLGVPFVENFRTANASNPRLARAGFARSGVSQQNRLVERHETTTGLYYWISYDFKPRKARGDLVRFPLGPKFDGNPHNRFAFDQDGGEAIFSLPNGMQAYLLVNAKGERLDDPAPADVVNDSRSIAGTPALVNGISCMNCHRRGMIGNFRDEIRGAGAVGGQC